MDLEELTTHEQHLFQGAEFLASECDYCEYEAPIRNMKLQLEIARKNRERLFSSVGRYIAPNASARYRRGLLDPIGEVSKILFGTMSASDANYYNAEIDKIHNDNKRNAELFKNQTQIVKISMEKITQLLTEYKSKLQTVQVNFKQISETERNLELHLVVVDHILQLDIAISEYMRTIDLLNQAIINVRHGEISPQLIEPSLLKETLLKLKLEKGTQHMPIDVDDSNYFEYLTISEISIVASRNRLIYRIKIPIMETDVFKGIRLITIPKRSKNNYFIYIDNPFEYLLINSASTMITPIDKDYLKDCKIIEGFYICKRKSAKYLTNVQGACFKSTVKSMNYIDASKCSPHMLTINVLTFIALLDGHSWVAIPPSEEEVKIICDNKTYSVTISEPCIFSMKAGCTAATDNAILDAQNNIGDGEPIRIHPDIIHYNTSSLQHDVEKIHNVSLYSLKALEQPKIDISDFKSYGKKLDELVNEAEIIGNHERTLTLYEQFWFWLPYIGYGLLASFGLYICYKCKLFKFCKWTVTPCTTIYNNCYNWGGNHTVSTLAENEMSVRPIDNTKNRHELNIPQDPPNHKHRNTGRKRSVRLMIPLSEFDENSLN